MVGDHTKTPKDGRRIPEVSTLHQNSETSSKPTYFRGHHWACIGLLINADRKFFATPLWTEIHRDSLQHSQSTRIVAIAGHIAKVMENQAYLILDAFFAVGPVFKVAAQQEGFLHILTRAKKNVVAYLLPVSVIFWRTNKGFCTFSLEQRKTLWPIFHHFGRKNPCVVVRQSTGKSCI